MKGEGGSILLGYEVLTIESKHLSTLQTYPKLYEGRGNERARPGGFLLPQKRATAALSFALKRVSRNPLQVPSVFYGDKVDRSRQCLPARPATRYRARRGPDSSSNPPKLFAHNRASIRGFVFLSLPSRPPASCSSSLICRINGALPNLIIAFTWYREMHSPSYVCALNLRK